MKDIIDFEAFVKFEPINKGFSNDKKYHVETADGRQMLLRISDISEYDCKKTEYEIMERAYEHGVPTSQPLGFGLCGGGKSVYSLSGWLDGSDIDSLLPKLGETEQYVLGIKSGELLRKIHTLPAPENTESWSIRLRCMIKNNIAFYHTHDFDSLHTELIINYLNENANILDSRPQTFIHGDFWVANLIVISSGEVAVIDFNNGISNYGDPWFELGYTMPWEGRLFYSHFYTALFKGYFSGDPPNEFYKLLKYYYAFHALATVRDIDENRGVKREESLKCFENIIRCFNDMQNTSPKWYLSDLNPNIIEN